MSIEINSINQNSQEPLRGKRNESNASQARAPEVSPESAPNKPKSTTVSLSNTAQVLSQAEAQLKESSDVDLERVEQLRTAITNGSYEADPKNMAQKMLDLE